MAESVPEAASISTDPAGPWDPWAPVLDDLEHRVEAAESGDLAALEGWEPPAVQPAPMSADDQHRATRILTRQRALLGRIREEQQVVAASMRAVRRPQYRAATAPPVYVDRLG
ncbi:hypothetical protein GCM10025783_22040 [Amnibacterium soli]|uniref:Flagellar protein FliT n=1 Tax=Amnibacterium soli TaxID=1282736 RepID=A0ABP8Z8D8_9MICO